MKPVSLLRYFETTISAKPSFSVRMRSKFPNLLGRSEDEKAVVIELVEVFTVATDAIVAVAAY